MNVRFRRFFATFSLIALVSVLAAAPSNAVDAPTGVGSAGGDVSLVSIDYGDLLAATLLGEGNSATIDPAIGVPTATETLSPLDVNSVTLPLLNALTVPSVQTTSSGAADSKTTALLDLSTLGVPGVTGTVNPASLTSLVDANGAKAALTSTLADLNVAGVLGVDAASLDLGGLAGPAASSATRGVTVDAISVLDLQALLNLLGLTIGDLSVEQVATLLDQLNELDTVNTILGTTNFSSPSDLTSAVSDLQSLITTVTTNRTALQAIAGTCTGTEVILTLLGIDCTEIGTTIADLTTQVNGLLDELNSTLQAAIDVLGGTPLLAIDGVTAGAAARAADTIANSSAIVTAAINDIRVGGLDFGAIDANTTLDQIAALATSVMTTLNQALATIDPSLANLLSVDLFQRATSVAQNGDYVEALAGITALALTVTPPDICALVNSVLAETPIASLTQGLTLPATPVTDLLDQVGSVVLDCFTLINIDRLQAQAIPEGAVAALTGPITFKAASLNSVANYKVVAAPAVPEVPALPRTGMNETLLLVVGGLMAAVALGLRRAAVPVKVRANRKK
ncbi:MAG: hypothetical protein QOI95_1030 [Acidimicrobiaceae bacterium]|jgi:hypothetical protein